MRLHINLCCLFCLLTKSAIPTTAEPLRFRVQRRTRGYQANSQSQLTTASTGKRKRRKENQCCIAWLCLLQTASVFSLRSLSVSVFERLDSHQPWAKGEATNNGSSISIFSLFHILHRLPFLAAILNLWLVIDPLARLHAQERLDLKRKMACWQSCWPFLQDAKDTNEMEGF